MIEKLNTAIQKHITVTGREPKCIIVDPEDLQNVFSSAIAASPLDLHRLVEDTEQPYIKYSGITVYRSTDVKKGEVIVA